MRIYNAKKIFTLKKKADFKESTVELTHPLMEYEDLKPAIPYANSKKYTQTNTAPLSKTPITPDNHLLEITAKIIPSSEREPKIIIANGKSAFGPLKIKNEIMLAATVKREKIPHLFIFSPLSTSAKALQSWHNKIVITAFCLLN